MAKGKATESSKKDLWELQSKLWNQPVGDFVSFLQGIGGDKVSAQGSFVIKLCCPFHADNSPSAFINLQQGFFKCYSGSCGKWTRDPIQLVRALDKGTYDRATEILRSNFAATFTKLKREDLKWFGLVDSEQRRARLISEACHTYACNVWQSSAAPELAKQARDWLKTTRRIDDIALIGCVGMLPREPDLERILDSLGATKEDKQAIKETLGAYLNTTYTDSVVYTYGESPEKITGFKFRIPNADKTSIRFEKVNKEYEGTGVFGVTMGSYAHLIANDKVDTFAVVEGEHDQISLYLEQLKTGIIDKVVVAGGGQGHNGVAFMAALGFSKCDVIGDDDLAGHAYAENLIKKSSVINFRVFSYPSTIKNPKHDDKIDPDEAIYIHGGAAVLQAIANPKNYTYAYEWCHGRAVQALSAASKDDVVTQLDAAVDYGQLLHTETEQRAFAQLFVADYPKLTIGEILQAISKGDDTPLAFIDRLTSAIERQYIPLYHDIGSNSLHLWQRDSRNEITLDLDLPKKALSLFQTRIGGVFYNWAKEEVGLPGYFPDVNDPSTGPDAFDKVNQKVEEALVYSFSKLAHRAANRVSLMDQGIHAGDILTTHIAYMINGNNHYRIEYSKTDATLSSVTRLTAPVDGTKVFVVDESRLFYKDPNEGWFPYDLEELLKTKPQYTPYETIDLIANILRDTFSFARPDTDALYCALLTFYQYVFDSMQKLCMTHIRGEFESGKSTLASVVANGEQISGYNFAFSSHVTDNYTLAGVFKNYANKRVMAILDEFNDPDDGSKESASRQGILASIRGLATRGSAERILGNSETSKRVEELAIPFVLLGATLFSNPMDGSRFNQIELQKRSKLVSIGEALRKYEPVVEALRKAVAYHSIHLLPTIAANYKNLYKAVTHNRPDKPFTITRTHENLMPLAAICDACGFNGIQFIKDFHAVRADQAKEREEVSPAQSLFNAVLYSSNFEVDIDSKPTRRSLSALLGRADWRELINTSDRGVFFDENTGFLAVVWPQVRQCLLGAGYQRTSTAALRTMASGSRQYVPFDFADSRGAVKRLRVMGMSSDKFNITFFDVNETINTVKTAHEELAKEAAAITGAVVVTPAKPKSNNPLDGMDL
jgi:hypothetical protein